MEGQLMYSRMFGVHGSISAVVAIAILGVSALVLDRAYLFSAPEGVVRIDPLTPVVTLEEIVVRGQR
jgi:hypothetical protein